MNNDNFFLAIEVSEVEDLKKYLYFFLLKELKIEDQKDLLRILDEIELYEIQYGKFFENKEALNEKRELKQGTIYVPDLVTGLLREIVILKKLTYSSHVDNVYEIRMSSEKNEYRLFIFPYDKINSYIHTPCVILTYGFDKQLKTRAEGNRITNMLRDSSQSIRDCFYRDGSGSLSHYIPSI